MGVEYSKADEVKEIARDLIVNYHTHLMNVRIEYLFVDPVPKSKGQLVWGTARKVTGLAAYLATTEESEEPGEPFFVVTISKEIWERLDDDRRKALVDHELAHCWLNDDGGLVILGHDLEEFVGVVKRHGLWRAEVEMFIRAAGPQIGLFDKPTPEMFGQRQDN